MLHYFECTICTQNITDKSNEIVENVQVTYRKTGRRQEKHQEQPENKNSIQLQLLSNF